MSNKDLIKLMDDRITSLADEGTTLEGFVVTSQAIAQMIIARHMLKEELKDE